MTCTGLVLFALFAPSAASAETCNAPPGTSGIDQYCESLPSPGGSGGGSHHGGGGGNGPKHVSPDAAKTLEHSGSAGQAVLNLASQSDAPAVTSTPAQSTPPATQKKTHRKHHQAASQQDKTTPATTSTPQRIDPGPPSSAPASNPAAAVGSSLGGPAGAGFLALLAAITAVFALIAWRGRRRPEPGS
jgi:hypothetical protein